MRRNFLTSVLIPSAIAALMVLWLLWNYLPLSLPLKWLLTGLGLAVTALILRAVRQQFQAEATVSEDLLETCPDGPVVLVMGEGLDALFGDALIRKSPTGSLHRINDADALRRSVEQAWSHSPAQAGRLSLMYRCLPDTCADEAAMRADICALRQLLHRLHQLTGFQLPLVVQCEFSGPATPWLLIADTASFTGEEGNQLSPEAWQQQGNNLTVAPLLRQASAFIRQTLLDELQKPDRVSPAVAPVAVSFRLGAEAGAPGTLWNHWLARSSAMHFVAARQRDGEEGAFAEPLYAVLAPLVVQVQGGKAAKRLLWVFLACALTALTCSALNNRHLIVQTVFSLKRWHAIPMESYAAKASSLAELKQAALTLERWHRQGEPRSYGLGFYPGQRLWLALQQAIDSYVPPPKPVVKAAPEIVRLDSMSLFDTGKFLLKPDSTKMLVNSLVGIKARPGWLIVVSGHTDNTGNPRLNQTLSLKRAESVRDWMRDTGDVPESCFAVQGYGESRPLESNDTQEGRAANRRVEISLVPQADACRIPDATLPSSQDDAGANEETE